MGRQARNIEEMRDKISTFMWIMMGIKGEFEGDEYVMKEADVQWFDEESDGEHSAIHMQVKKLRDELKELTPEERMKVSTLTFRTQKGRYITNLKE